MSSLNEQQKQRIEESRRKALALRAAKLPQISSPQANSANRKPEISAGLSSGVHGKGVEVASYPGSRNVTTVRPTQPGGVSCATVSKSSIGGLFHGGPSKSGLCGVSSGQTTTHSHPSIAHNTPNKQASTSQSSAKQFYSSGSKKDPAASRNKSVLSNYVQSTDSPSKPGAGPKSASVKGKCVLISRERFMVEVGYCAPLIAMFKNMASKQYDMTTKTWSFELGEYSTLMERLQHFDTVSIEGLPKCVMMTFDSALSGATQTRHIPEADLSDVDSDLVDKLMEFQKEGVNFAISHGGRVLLADDMGLGKTIQALCVAAYYRKDWPILIIVPSSVRFAWREQILRWLPSVDPQGINVVVTGKESCTSGDINILSYDLMVRKQKELTAKGFQFIIMDESHFLKNQKTARTQVAFPLLKKARRVMLLSGTPALSRPSELFVQLSAISTRLFPRFHEFGVRYCDGKQMQWGWDFSGSSNLAELQLVLEDRIMIRRLKKHVLKELPAKVRQMVVLDSSAIKIGKEMKASHKYVDKAKGSDRRSALLEYFHETGTAKKKAVREYVMDQLESDSKLLVFAHHQEVLDEIEESVAKKHGYIRIDGQTSAEKRSVFCDRFQKQETVRVALLSICAANAGINLTAASLVIFAELFWNPGILVQAEDRAHRIGQQDSVSIQYLIATGTADDFVWPLVQSKLAVLGKAGLSKENFTEAETTHFKDPKQRDIMSYFEESFFEEDMVFEEDGSPGSAAAEHPTLPAASCNNDNNNTTHKKNGSLFQYFKLDNETVSSEITSDRTADTSDSANQQTVFPEHESDWLDDETLRDIDDDVDPDAPWPKKPRLR